MGSDLAFDLRHARECLVPARFQLASHQPIGWISRVVLPESTISLIASRFEIPAECLAHLISPLPGVLLGGNRGLDGTGSDDAQEGFLDGIIDAQPSEGDAAGFTIVQPAAAAAVARDIMLRARVTKRQLATAAAA